MVLDQFYEGLIFLQQQLCGYRVVIIEVIDEPAEFIFVRENIQFLELFWRGELEKVLVIVYGLFELDRVYNAYLVIILYERDFVRTVDIKHQQLIFE